VGHETATSEAAVGRLSELQVVPPSVVLMIVYDVELPDCCPPTAQQVDADGHEIESSPDDVPDDSLTHVSADA
jgi:hypothetical protein